MTMNLERTELFCFVEIPGGDVLANVEPLADGAKVTYRFRWYDPDDPRNDAFSNKDKKSWYSGVCPSMAEGRKVIEQLALFLVSMGGGPVHTIERAKGESFENFFERFKKLPFVHTKSEPIQ